MTFSNALVSVDSATTTCGSVASAGPIGQDAVVNLEHVNCNATEITVTVNGITDDQGNTLDSASVTFGLLIGT